VSKKNTWRIWASSGSSPRAATVDRWAISGTVIFSSTLSAPSTNSISRIISSLMSLDVDSDVMSHTPSAVCSTGSRRRMRSITLFG
jgi:hypothetical protein